LVAVTVFGGSGFLGIRLVQRLVDSAMVVRVAVRHPERARAALADGFARDGFVPPPLVGMVSGSQARTRWQALRDFYAKHGHFLVTNGPYQLKSWWAEATVLEVFRDMSYPLGVGSYDAYAIPRRAYIAGIEARGGGLDVSAEIENVEKFARSHRVVREAVASARIPKGDTLECRYLAVGADGVVARAGIGQLQDNGRFRIDLDRIDLPPGSYTVIVTLTLNGNAVNPDIRTVASGVETWRGSALRPICLDRSSLYHPMTFGSQVANAGYANRIPSMPIWIRMNGRTPL